MYEFLRLSHEGGVTVLTLHRPQAYNAWHHPMRLEIVDALRKARDDENVRAIVLTGSGDEAFSAGQDLAEAQQFDADAAVHWIDDWNLFYGTLREIEKPVVAAINGVAAGSAFQVTLLCDLRVGHPGTRMGQPEIDSGIPSTLGPWLMWDILGKARTVELWFTGRMVDGEEAHRLGLLTELVPQDRVLPRALELAMELAAKPPLAMRLNKRRLREITEAGFREAEDAGRRYQAEAFGSGEPQRMMDRFFAERAARKERSGAC
jgi:enoyl-CoA hydratase/carnithine racemase